MDYERFLDLVKRRRSYWEFRPDPVALEDVQKVIDAARWAPTGFNSQPWEFVVVGDTDLREEIGRIISEAMPPRRPGGGPPPGPGGRRKDPMGFMTAPVFIVLLGDTRVRGYGPPDLQRNDTRWRSIFTSSLAIPFAYMHLAATSLGLASRWVSATGFDPAESRIKELLGVPDDFVIYDMMALGYSDFVPAPREVRELSEVVHHDRCAPAEFRSMKEVEQFFGRRSSPHGGRSAGRGDGE